ncbi:hypothetical protein L249_7544 [Ophiocordyceps polyrhachis-furcata BCC 54312]|uniref:Hpc2-related domain-containing protein n=1 Tax=Ophiocordyceps polyrhachis-furcata BCC 54312 TaxID=1330021 RepID=A0A367LAH4_9HYPO|nr:hypothetical protein L249_7544 [Ophiocordyceps polyrhachis-furcata BCC 54312]
MATAAVSSRYESSTGELSSPPSGSLSEPTSPSGPKSMDQAEIVVGSDQPHPPSQPSQPPGQITFQQYPAGQRPAKKYELINGQLVQLTAAGVPRKKPGRKPGTMVKPKDATSSSEPPKSRKPRKPKESSSTTTSATTAPSSGTNAAAPPIPRKRKLAPVSDLDTDADAPRPTAPSASLPSQMTQHHHQRPGYSRDASYPGSMQNILNADPPASSSTVPVRSIYDPIRGNYDPVRETITAFQPPPPTASPRAPTQLAHRSPSIASLLEPQAAAASPSSQTHHLSASQSRLQQQQQNDSPSSMPTSPSYRQASNPGPTKKEAAIPDGSKDTPPPPAPPPPSLPPPPPTSSSQPAVQQRPVVNQAKFTTISSGPIRKVDKSHTGVSTPKTDNAEDPCHESEGRSILDFGKAKPGEELQVPTIILNVPLKMGETNKYVNFMRMAEERYGWDALHPRLAANRERKARIAAAAASLEKVDSSRESGDEMSVDLSDAEASNQENGGTSGPDAQAKPKKKRTLKEDKYDVDDDFVDDSELLWEAQAAASRDGFFVYSGPLVPEVERPPAGYTKPPPFAPYFVLLTAPCHNSVDGQPKRGRGSRGGRGGRGAARGAGAGRGGGPGSRGGAAPRKPRATKSEKLQRDREKAELSKTPTATNPYALQPTTPSFTVSELGA